MENVQELFRSARDEESAGDVDRTIGLYEEIIGRDPGHAGAFHALGVLMNRRANFGRAAARLERAVALRPSDPAFHVELAEGYRNLGAHRDAIGCGLTGLRLRPEYPEGWNTLGLAIRGAGDVEGALERFLRAISCREDFFAAHVNAGQAMMELGRVDQVIPHFRRAVELAPDSCQARTSLGLALSDRGLNDEALPHLEEAARLGPDLGAAHHNLGNGLRLLGRLVEARSSNLKAIRIDPGAALSYLHVGLTLRLEGALHDALRWYKIAVEMEPDNPHLWEELADLHQKRDEPDEAESCRRRVLDLAPADPLAANRETGINILYMQFNTNFCRPLQAKDVCPEWREEKFVKVGPSWDLRRWGDSRHHGAAKRSLIQEATPCVDGLIPRWTGSGKTSGPTSTNRPSTASVSDSGTAGAAMPS